MTYNYTKAIIAFSIFTYFTVFFVLSGIPDFENSSHEINEVAISGRKIWLKNNCISCHSIYGLGGFLGPDLTELAGRRDNIYIRQVILNGTGKMPAFRFSDDEVNSLLAYFQYTFDSRNTSR
ncbi:MAG: cytochrome c [Leptospirales bacterium]